MPSHDCSTDHVVDERKHILDGVVVVDLVEQAQEQDSISAALLQKTKKRHLTIRQPHRAKSIRGPAGRSAQTGRVCRTP